MLAVFCSSVFFRHNEPLRANVMPVGDIHSDAAGSGARFNDSKPALDLIPAGIIASYHGQRTAVAVHRVPNWPAALAALGDFQMRKGSATAALHDAIYWSGADWAACARVFHYGKTKYAAWNWSKGMPWSVPIACAARHVVFGPMAGEEDDAESHQPHAGHFMCNIVMLLWFLEHYPEGDDRYVPPVRVAA